MAINASKKGEVKIHFKTKFNPKPPNKARRAGNAAVMLQ